jgi:hypothetical protein
MLCGAPKIRRFLMIPSHFSKIIFEKGLFRQFQRLALAAVGGTRVAVETENTQSYEKGLKTRRIPLVG